MVFVNHWDDVKSLLLSEVEGKVMEGTFMDASLPVSDTWATAQTRNLHHHHGFPPFISGTLDIRC